MKYVGSRYVPKFLGTYDDTTAYEALSVVDNGMGTSYISNKPVPAGTPLTDTSYWSMYGATSGAIINLQDQIDDMKDPLVTGSLQQQITANTNHVTAIDPYEKFRNKTICVIGDSISSYSTLANNWVKYLSDFMDGYDCTVINKAVDGATFAGVADAITQGTYVIPAADYYIVFLGTNYVDSWGYTTGTNPLASAVGTVINTIISVANAGAKFFYVSPLKKWLTGIDSLLNPLPVMRYVLENVFSRYGFTVLSGYNIGELSILTKSTYLMDDIHPDEAFSPILFSYILDGLVSERSNITQEGHVKRTQSNTMGTSSVVTRYTGNRIDISITAFTYSPNTGEWIDVCDLPTFVDDHSEPDGMYGLSNGGPYTYLYRVQNGKLQVYFYVAPTGGTFYDTVTFFITVDDNT